MQNGTRTRLVRWIDQIITVIILLGTLGLFSYGCYAIWDANEVVSSALPDKYEKYKPDKTSVPLENLMRENPDVLGWIQVYATNIDYPLVRGEDNQKYLAKDASGNYSLSGSIFLDYRNDRSFNDFNHIIYGHHMEYHTMFGDVSEFKDADYFRSHRYGKLFFDGREMGIDFFAFLEADAYATFVYKPALTSLEDKQKYLQDIYSSAVNSRQIGVTENDKLVLLSTCTSGLTNGRHILVGRLTDEVVEEVKEQKPSKVHPYVEVNKEIVSIWILVVTIALIVIWVIAIKIKASKKRGKLYDKKKNA